MDFFNFFKKKENVTVHKRHKAGKHRYDWKRQLPDHRDIKYKDVLSIRTVKALPPKIDLRPKCSPIVDQGQVSSCTGNAIAGAFEFLELQQLASKTPGAETFQQGTFKPASRLFIYYGERLLEGTVDEDAGAEIRDGVKVLNKTGVCSEPTWAYTDANVFKKPSPAAYAEASNHKITQYLSITNLYEMKHSLSDGFPVVFGIAVFESFESDKVAQTGIVPMPGMQEACVGGHAILAVGYDDVARVVICRNSWGTSWGQKGYFTLPYNYVSNMNLASDFWTIRK